MCIQDGFSALMWACLWGHGSVVSQLVSGGAEIGSQNEVIAIQHIHDCIYTYNVYFNFIT